MIKKLKKMLMHNLKLKIIAVLSACVLWVYVMSVIDPVVTRTIDGVLVNIQNTEELSHNNMIMTSPSTITVSVKVSGRKSTIYDIKAEDIKAQTDARGYGEGEFKAPIFVNIPEGIDEIRDYYPKEVLFEFEKVIEKQFPIVLETEGEIAENHKLSTPQLTPSAVILRGPRSEINSVEKVIARIDVTDARDNIESVLPITALDSNAVELTSITKEPGIVTVIQPVDKMKYISIRPKFVNESPQNVKLLNYEVSPTLVRIYGPEDALSEMTILESQEIDLSQVIESGKQALNFELPSGVHFENEKGAEITFTVEPILEQQVEFTTEEVKIQNLRPEFQAVFLYPEQKIILSVTDIQSKIDALKSEGFMLYLDGATLEEGVHEVPIQYFNPNGIQITEEPIIISIEIKKAEAQ